MKSVNRKKAARVSERLKIVANTIVLAPGERWCVRCGETMFNGNACPRCDGRAWIDPKLVLQPGEFVEASPQPGQPREVRR